MPLAQCWNQNVVSPLQQHHQDLALDGLNPALVAVSIFSWSPWAIMECNMSIFKDLERLRWREANKWQAKMEFEDAAFSFVELRCWAFLIWVLIKTSWYPLFCPLIHHWTNPIHPLLWRKYSIIYFKSTWLNSLGSHWMLRFGVSKVIFTDGQGALIERNLPYCPKLDVPHPGCDGTRHYYHNTHATSYKSPFTACSCLFSYY